MKTRLARDVGAANALEIYKILLQHSFDITSDLKVTKQVWYSDEIPERDIWNGADYLKKLQKGEDLGERMLNAFKEGFSQGFQKIVIIGTDLYELETGNIQEAFRALDKNEYVIGPAKDGGYYLLGMKCLNSKVFRNKEWSTSGVLSETLKDLEGSRIKFLPTQNDIDVLDDIKAHQTFQKFLNL